MSRARRGRVNTAIIVVGLLFLIPFIGILASGFGKNPREVPSVLEQTPAMPFSLQDLDGRTVTLDSLRGKTVLLNFWSTWCQPCRIEHPLLQQAARDWPDVVFLGVLYSDEPEAARRYVAQNDSAYPILIDPGGRTAIAYGVAGVPESFVITPDGMIAHKQPGPFSASELIEAVSAYRAPGARP